MGEEVERRNAELEREVTGLRNSYWSERKAHLAAEAQVEAMRKVLERCYHAADTRRDTAGLRFTAHPAFEDAANLLAALSAPAEESSLQKMQSAPAEESSVSAPAIPLLSYHADFDPDGEPDLIAWTFYAARDVPVSAGLFELRFLRVLTEDERSAPVSSVLLPAPAEARSDKPEGGL